MERRVGMGHRCDEGKTPASSTASVHLDDIRLGFKHVLYGQGACASHFEATHGIAVDRFASLVTHSRRSCPTRPSLSAEPTCQWLDCGQRYRENSGANCPPQRLDAGRGQGREDADLCDGVSAKHAAAAPMHLIRQRKRVHPCPAVPTYQRTGIRS